MNRRRFLASTAAVLSASAVSGPVSAAGDTNAQLAKLEASTGGRLGVVVIARGRPRLSYRANERFAMCSTFKFLAVADMLTRVDAGRERLDRQIHYTSADLLAYAPVTRAHLSQGYMTIEALCEAAIEYSDNTAANLLLRAFGGAPEVTRFARSIGDPMTRLDRTEPTLNTDLPGDPRDTTTPLAMARDMERVLLGPVLSVRSRDKLIAWMVKCQTGTTCLRAGFPPAWTVGDKTGLGGPVNATGDSRTRNDIAIAWPSHGRPVIVTAYLSRSQLPPAQRDAVLAKVAQIAATDFGS